MKIYMIEHYQFYSGFGMFSRSGTEIKIKGAFASFELAKSDITETYNAFSKHDYLILEMNKEGTGFSYGTGDSTSFTPGGFRIVEQEVKDE